MLDRVFSLTVRIDTSHPIEEEWKRIERTCTEVVVVFFFCPPSCRMKLKVTQDVNSKRKERLQGMLNERSLERNYLVVMATKVNCQRNSLRYMMNWLDAIQERDRVVQPNHLLHPHLNVYCSVRIEVLLVLLDMVPLLVFSLRDFYQSITMWF